MINQRDVLKEKKESRQFDGQGFAERLKSMVIDPPWVRAIRKHIEDNYEAAAVFAENATTKYIIDALERDIAANLKALKTERTDTGVRLLQGIINGLETSVNMIKRLQNEVKKH